MKIKPKCLQSNTRPLGHSAEGYLLPCCWCDNIVHKDKYTELLYQEQLKIQNNDRIESIIDSREWQQFVDAIHSDDPPNVCKTFCGELTSTKETIIIKPI
jgi:acetyl-CoA carboxylase beta subunit